MISVRMEKGKAMKKYVELEDVIQRLDNAIYCANNGEFGYDEALKRLRIAYSKTMLTIEASEDCIDRYSALAELYPLSYEYKAVKELPPVIPKRSCYRCGLREDCEDSTERKSKEGEWIGAR